MTAATNKDTLFGIPTYKILHFDLVYHEIGRQIHTSQQFLDKRLTQIQDLTVLTIKDTWFVVPAYKIVHFDVYVEINHFNLLIHSPLPFCLKIETLSFLNN